MGRNKYAAAKGAEYEITVAADLMRQGFEVFRNLSPAGATDLIARKTPHVLLRVQVKSANGGTATMRGNDVLALCEPKLNRIRYQVLNECLLPLFKSATLMKIRGVKQSINGHRQANGFNVPDYKPEATNEQTA